ncbi:hypothetical protein FH972_023374 [Carpinus fangiana]|uniref:Succinate dehydrogenase assembly factor 4, mitochondrial n=1 Tax=Carpinus fangiana TaxID=176857 RepID=A0A5N6KV13_9ROSI|nr:hypothetical protein FH972_023374 [Carpinus fangiana]
MSPTYYTTQRLFSTPIALSRRAAHLRLLHTTRTAATAWSPGPAPPRLPKEEQEIFEQLQKDSTGAFSTPTSQRESPDARPNVEPRVKEAGSEESWKANALEEMRARIRAKGDGEELHPNVRRGAAPEFEGDVNPKTGEVGGPKNDPIRWGSDEQKGDWSYNGRVTDF